MSSINISIKKSKIISIILIWSLIWIGFIGLLVFDGVIDNTLVQGKTIIVDPNGKGNYTKIQYAIENASSGDIIRVWDGIYYEALTINKTLSIIGNGS